MDEPILLILVALAAAVVGGLAAAWFLRGSRSRRMRRLAEDLGRRPVSGTDALERIRSSEDLTPLADEVGRIAEALDRLLARARADRARLEEILAAMDEGIVLLGNEGDVRYANPAARRVLGAEPGSLRTLTPAALRALVEEAAESRRSSSRELDTGLPVRTLLATAIPVAGGIVLALRDVTAARRVDAIRRDFVADASHELKTPAAAIQAAAETLERAVHDDPKAAARFTARLRHEAGRLARIVAELLDLSRLESERPESRPVRLDLLAVEEAERLRSKAVDGGIELEVDASPVTVSGSPKDLALLVGNLLENAVQYTPPGGRVRLGVVASDGQAEVVVADTGIGIPTRDLPRVFERFYRVDRARSRATGGTGLGLSIARHVAEQHGGRIEAESELGRGTTFRVILPAGGTAGSPEVPGS